MRRKDRRTGNEYCPKGKELARRIAEVQAKWTEADRERKDQWRRTVKPVRSHTYGPTATGIEQVD